MSLSPWRKPLSHCHKFDHHFHSPLPFVFLFFPQCQYLHHHRFRIISVLIVCHAYQAHYDDASIYRCATWWYNWKWHNLCSTCSLWYLAHMSLTVTLRMIYSARSHIQGIMTMMMLYWLFLVQGKPAPCFCPIWWWQYVLLAPWQVFLPNTEYPSAIDQTSLLLPLYVAWFSVSNCNNAVSFFLTSMKEHPVKDEPSVWCRP